MRKYIQNCHICQLVKCSNEKREGVMIPITSTTKLEKVFLDICGPFPRRDVYKRQGLTHLEGREQIDFRAYVKNPLEFSVVITNSEE